MKSGKIFIGLAAIALVSCNNFFHELVPPDGNSIVSFEVPGQTGPAIIIGNTVEAAVEKGTDLRSLLPKIGVSPKASLFPLTLDYIRAAFPSADLLKEAIRLYTAADLPAYALGLIERNPDFKVPALDIPIDFSGPVDFFVVSGQGTVRQYTVYVKEDRDEPKLLGLRFAKYDNPELVFDAACVINEGGLTISAQAAYPAEMDGLSFALIPSFEIFGDGFEVDGRDIQSGVDSIQFDAYMGMQSKTLRVLRYGEYRDYELAISFSEDPDTVRSITDFRFNRAENPSIAATAVASIFNTDGTGTISVQAFYSGAEPPSLTPRFVSPGTVSVNGLAQTSGASPQDFSSPLEYRVVSRNGLYTRLYTVRVELVSLTSGAPRITSFRFSAALNPELSQDAVAEISDGLIMIDAKYSGASAPLSLVPEFSAEGLVKVLGSVQVSGMSGQDFGRQLSYKVTNPGNALLERDYRVQCRMTRDSSSDAAISAFGFYPGENPCLADAVLGKIDHINGKISVYAPAGSGLTAARAYPRFAASGQVSVEGAPQVSGVSGRVFDGPVRYTVVSANGLNTKSYVVDVRELRPTIYVNRNASGLNDGTCWADAFISLKAACEAAVQFPEDVPKEIWIAVGAYTPGLSADDYFPLAPNTSYLGGFGGWEAAKGERNNAALATISGELGGGVRAKRLFASDAVLDGDLLFENLSLSGARGRVGESKGVGIYALLDEAAEMEVRGCVFGSMETANWDMDEGIIYTQGGSAVISHSVFTACTGAVLNMKGTTLSISDTDFSYCNTQRWLIQLDCSGELEIRRVNVSDYSGYVFYISGKGNKTLETLTFSRGVGYGTLTVNGDGGGGFTGNFRAEGIDMQDLSGSGIFLSHQNGVKYLSGITGRNIGSYPVLSSGTGSFTLKDSNFDNCMYLSLDNPSVTIENTEITNPKPATNGIVYGISIRASDTFIDGLTVDGVRGRGINMTINGNGRAAISNTLIKDCILPTGNTDSGGIYIAGSGNAYISDTTITGCEAGNYGGGIYITALINMEISNTLIDNCKARDGGGIYQDGGSILLDNSRIKNCSAGRVGGGVYVQGGGTFTMKGGEISGNTAEAGGGGVGMLGGTTFAMEGGEIFGNKALSGGGGGVNITNSSFIKTGGIIYGSDGGIFANNNQNNFGHAVYATGGGTTKRKETTAGEGVNLGFIYNGSTATFSGGWDY